MIPYFDGNCDKTKSYMLPSELKQLIHIFTINLYNILKTPMEHGQIET